MSGGLGRTRPACVFVPVCTAHAGVPYPVLRVPTRMPARARVAEGGRELCEPDGVSRRTAALLLLRDAAERWRRRVERRRINFC